MVNYAYSSAFERTVKIASRIVSRCYTMDPAEEQVTKTALPRPRGWTLGERKGMGKEKRNGKEGNEREMRGGKEKGTRERGGGRETRERKEARGKEGILCSCEFFLRRNTGTNTAIGRSCGLFLYT